MTRIPERLISRLTSVVIDLLEYRDLNDVIRVGHSYSGIVVGQVSTRLKNCIAHAIFIEAFLHVDEKFLLEVSELDVVHEK